MLFAAVAFAVVFVIFVGTYWVLQVLPEQKAERELERRLQPVKRRRLGESIELLRRVNPISTVPLLRNTLGRVATTASLERKIEQSGLPLTVGRVVLAMGFLAMVGLLRHLDAVAHAVAGHRSRRRSHRPCPGSRSSTRRDGASRSWRSSSRRRSS